MQGEIEISLGDLFDVLKRKIVWILIVTLVLGVAGFAYGGFKAETSYSASAGFYVYMNVDYEHVNPETEQMPGFSVARDLLNVFTLSLTSNDVLEEVIQKSGESLTPDQLSSMLTITKADASGSVVVSVKANSESTRYMQ